jgi:hypothetical protein
MAATRAGTPSRDSASSGWWLGGFG